MPAGRSPSTPPWRILASTALRAVRYDPGTRTLRVLFTNGSLYEYLDVPPDVVGGLLDPGGGSHGRYFQAEIRDRYEFHELRRDLGP